jgi:hypothetical protein
MTTITVKINDSENVSFFLRLIQKLNFIAVIHLNEEINPRQLSVSEAPIDWAETNPSIKDFFGIWSGRNITLDELRDKAWKRN